MGNLENDEIVIQTYVDPDTQVEYFIVNPGEPNMCAVPRFLPDCTLKTMSSCLQSNVRYTTDDFMSKIFYLKDDGAVGGFQPIGFISACDLSNEKQFKFGVTPIDQVIPQGAKEQSEKVEWEYDPKCSGSFNLLMYLHKKFEQEIAAGKEND